MKFSSPKAIIAYHCYQCNKLFAKEVLIYDDEIDNYICHECNQKLIDEYDDHKSQCMYCEKYFDTEDMNNQGDEYDFKGYLCNGCFENATESSERKEVESEMRPGRW